MTSIWRIVTSSNSSIPFCTLRAPHLSFQNVRVTLKKAKRKNSYLRKRSNFFIIFLKSVSFWWIFFSSVFTSPLRKWTAQLFGMCFSASSIQTLASSNLTIAWEKKKPLFFKKNTFAYCRTYNFIFFAFLYLFSSMSNLPLATKTIPTPKSAFRLLPDMERDTSDAEDVKEEEETAELLRSFSWRNFLAAEKLSSDSSKRSRSIWAVPQLTNNITSVEGEKQNDSCGE